MRHILLLTTGLFIAAPAFASEKADHFKAPKPTTHCEALTQLRDAHAATEKAKTQKNVPMLHKQSYILREAVDYLKQEQTVLADAIEAMHEASETTPPKALDESYQLYYTLVTQQLTPCP